VVNKLLAYLPRGNTLDAKVWRRRHLLLQWILLLHVPGLFLFGLGVGRGLTFTFWAVAPLGLCIAGGMLTQHRRFASLSITAGLVYCSAALVGLSRGSIEAHFHFFVMIGFIALYQDWVPFLWNIVFTVVSHGVGSIWQSNLIFNHPAGQTNPWVWSGIHGLAVLAACVGVVLFWRTTEDEQQKTLTLRTRLADAEISRRKFTSDLLVNLARRNQSLLYRQLGVINQLEEQEKDPDALADLFRLDHLATRIRRNAESLLVLSGEDAPRIWSNPVLLVDVVRAAIAETEDLDRVVFDIEERLAVSGKAVADLTHLLAELVENAVHFSPPQARVIIRTRPYLQLPGGQVLAIEDWGVGLRPEDLENANELLADPPEVDLSVSRRLGLHVVARLARRHGIGVSLTPTPGCGVTAVVVMPPELFSDEAATPVGQPDDQPQPVPAMAAARPAKAVLAGSVAPSAMLAQPPVNSSAWNSFPTNGPEANNSQTNGSSFSSGFGDGADTPTWPGWFPAADSSGQNPETPAPASSPARPLPVAPPMPAAPPVPPAPPAAQAPPAGPASSPAPDAAGGFGSRLSRRVPQAHLAPELRRDDAATGDNVTAPGPPAPDAAQTRTALSRYQASRRAARAIVEGTATDDDDPSASGGDWA